MLLHTTFFDEPVQVEVTEDKSRKRDNYNAKHIKSIVLTLKPMAVQTAMKTGTFALSMAIKAGINLCHFFNGKNTNF